MTGFAVYGQFNDSYAFRDRPAIHEHTPAYELQQTLVPDMSGASRPGVRRCPACGGLLAKWEDPLKGLVIKKRRFDISITYDGIVVVSNTFKSAYDSNGLSGLRFIPLPDDPEFSKIQAIEVVAFDAERRKTRFIKQCATCGQFESVVGATPVYLKERSTVSDLGFVRTDLEFASDDEKHPLLLCGLSAGKALKNAKLKGLDLIAF